MVALQKVFYLKNSIKSRPDFTKKEIFMIDFLKLIRPKHYIKNIIILLPVIFSGSFFVMEYFLIYFPAFLSFCFASSTVYIFNDIADKQNDSSHSIKRNRPVASGRVSIPKAWIYASLMLSLSILFNFLASKTGEYLSWIFLFSYIVIYLYYSFKGKNIPVIDIAILAFGFIIRLIYGGVITGVEISGWLYLTIVSVSFYFALGKRRNEFIKSSFLSRPVLKFYTKEFLDKNMYLCLAIGIVFYSLWAVDPVTIQKVGGTFLLWTVPLVILISLKYNHILESDSFGDPVDIFSSSRWIQGLVALYALTVIWILYFK